VFLPPPRSNTTRPFDRITCTQRWSLPLPFLPAMSSPPTTQNGQRSASRSSSLGSRFLRRAKSTEPLSDRKSSSSRLLRKKSSEKDEAARQREAGALQPQPPTLPNFSSYPQLQSFGGEMPDRTKGSNMPVPPVPVASANEPVDPYARTESMTHRGRYSYASSAVSTMTNPRRVRRRKDPTPYKYVFCCFATYTAQLTVEQCPCHRL
jgi:hypothetical protein